MPSFDIVSKIDQHELNNALDQARREIDSRFDFKGVNAVIALKEKDMTLTAPSDFQVQQMLDIVQNKIAKRGLDIRCLDIKKPEIHLHETRQVIVVRQGIETEIAKKIVKFTKDSKLKVQAAIQGEQVRVTGKQRDDLQSAITALKKENFNLPLQFENFRD